MKSKLSIALCFLFFLSSDANYAQDFKKDLNLIKEKYSPKNKIVSYNIKYLYTSFTGKKSQKDSMKGEFILSPTKTYSNFDGFECLNTNELNISIVPDVKEMYVAKNTPHEENSNNQSIDQFLKETHRWKWVKIKNNSFRHVRFFDQSGAIDSMDLVYSIKSYEIKNLKIYFNPNYDPELNSKVILDITLNNLKFQDVSSKIPQLEVSRYLKKNSKPYLVSDKYKKYELVLN